MITNTAASVITLIRGHVKDKIKNDGRNVFEFKGDSAFRLSQRFIDADSILVYKNGVLLNDNDWSFDADTNLVTVDINTTGDSLDTNDLILATYDYYKKYSDTELQGYLESSLSYFVMHRYCKTFEISSTNTIVTVNGLNPTTNDLYFISIIASILIDPQNITIKTEGFELGSNRQISDQEQISLAFAQMKRFVGEIKFEIIEDFPDVRD